MKRVHSVEPALYALWASACTLGVAMLFFGSTRLQTHFSALEAEPMSFARAAQGAILGDWSAPLDDVFIHFDFARATARGHPFEWSEGNGYSSGGTSLLYPLTLAVGWWAGLRDLKLVVWAGVIACVAVLATLLGARRLFAGLPRGAAWVLPPVFLSIGALDWTLMSGMEVALFIALSVGALRAWDDIVRPKPDSTGPLVLGLWCGAAAATRPEALVIVAVFASTAAWSARNRRGNRSGLTTLAIASAPAALVLVAQTVANMQFTGEPSSAGALAKLELHHPHLTREQVFDAWKFHVAYQILRVTHYHLSEQPGWGWLLWALALVPLAHRETRRFAALLWVSALAWILVVALNGQVRWQNERYTMPAVAWLVLSSAMGLGVLFTADWARGRRAIFARSAGIILGAATFGAFVWHQEPRFREQVWFFGRASRNIRDQHVLAGRLLRHLTPPPTRVLVGDAGAIPYVSDLPSLDIIGLGGYADLPFARATRWGVPAALELLQRMPPRERPDAMALYPSWWGSLPLWFGDALAHVPVRGNVICGGPTKVIYRSDWRALADEGPLVDAGERIADELDFGDIVSEAEHRWALSRQPNGFLDMKILADPRSRAPLWDAGRIVPEGIRETFTLRGLRAGHGARVTVRSAPTARVRINVTVAGQSAGVLALEPAGGWVETSATIPPALVGPSIDVALENEHGERVLHHLWAIERE